jgi:putative SOS response-associated peptidase YedK
MIASYPAMEMRAVPVSAKINSVRNQGADLIEPAGEPLA